MAGRLFVLGAAILGLAGCIPYWTEHYYEPAASGGTLEARRCPIPPSTLRFTIGAIVVGLSGHQRGDRLGASLYFLIPDGHVVQLTESRIAILPTDGDPVIGQLADISVSARRAPFPRIAIDAPMVGASRPVFHGAQTLAPQGFSTRNHPSASSLRASRSTASRRRCLRCGSSASAITP